MSEETLECVLEEEVHYGCSPPEVLQALSILAERVEKHRKSEPGVYRECGPAARWSTENLRSNWRLTTKLYRQSPVAVVAPVSAVPPVVKPDAIVPAAVASPVPTRPAKVEVSDAVKIQSPAQPNAGRVSQPVVLKEGGGTAIGGT